MKLKAGYKQTEVGIIPNEWNLKVLNEISSITRLAGYEYSTMWEENPNGEIIALRGFNIGQNRIIDREFVRISNELSLKLKRSRLYKGNIIYPCVGTIGNAVVIEEDDKYHIQQNIAKITPNETEVIPAFLSYYLMSSFGLNEIKKFNGSSSQPNILVGSLRQYSIILPTKVEQTAIATALSDADALISSLEKLIEKKRNIKQGAMQELLKPKKGWVVKRVEDISQVGRGRVISHKEIALSLQNTYPVYSSQTTNNGIMGYIDTFDFDGEYVTWTTDGENAGTVFYRNGKFNCTNVCGTIKVKLDNARFIAFLLNTVTSMYVSKNLANPKLMNDPMKKIEIALPSKEEQDRIADVIMDMENEVMLLEKKLSKSKMLKQGMMQELLTGKIRLV